MTPLAQSDPMAAAMAGRVRASFNSGIKPPSPDWVAVPRKTWAKSARSAVRELNHQATSATRIVLKVCGQRLLDQGRFSDSSSTSDCSEEPALPPETIQ